MKNDFIIGADDAILVTGATGFVGSRVVANLRHRGFRNIRCFARRSSDLARLSKLAEGEFGKTVSLFEGSLLSQSDCDAALNNVAVVFHLAAGGSAKSYADSVMNTVVPTRNLLEAARKQTSLKRFLNVSSLAVYSNSNHSSGRTLDETNGIEPHPELRGDAYSYAKIRQDDLVEGYGREFGIPYVIVRPGYVYGPEKRDISSRVGVDTFGPFLHLGGGNTIPFTYVDNCADAIVLAGLTPGIEREAFNIVDDDLPSSRAFLRSYKRQVRAFRSIYVPHAVSYALCRLWEWYANRSGGQLAPVFNRQRWNVYWKSTKYSNHKIKTMAGWKPEVTTAEGLRRYFESCRDGGCHA